MSEPTSEQYAKMICGDPQANLERQIQQSYYNFMAAMAFADACSKHPNPPEAVKVLLNMIRDALVLHGEQEAAERAKMNEDPLGAIFGGLLASSEDLEKRYQEGVNTTHSEILTVILEMVGKLS